MAISGKEVGIKSGENPHRATDIHHVYIDNFFTSEELIVDLEKDGMYAGGTAWKDWRGFPEHQAKHKVLLNFRIYTFDIVSRIIHLLIGENFQKGKVSVTAWLGRKVSHCNIIQLPAKRLRNSSP